MDVKLILERKEKVEKFALILCVGIAACLRENVLNIDEAQTILFSPHSVDRLKKGGARRAIQDLIFLACELEDVASLIPESLDKSILEVQDKAIEMLRGMKELDPRWKNWLE